MVLKDSMGEHVSNHDVLDDELGDCKLESLLFEVSTEFCVTWNDGFNPVAQNALE